MDYTLTLTDDRDAILREESEAQALDPAMLLTVTVNRWLDAIGQTRATDHSSKFIEAYREAPPEVKRQVETILRDRKAEPPLITPPTP
jgi:hypothetical protein